MVSRLRTGLDMDVRHHNTVTGALASCNRADRECTRSRPGRRPLHVTVDACLNVPVEWQLARTGERSCVASWGWHPRAFNSTKYYSDHVDVMLPHLSGGIAMRRLGI